MITCKSEYKNLNDLDWVAMLDLIWKNPAPWLWLEILNLFEGISDVIDVNFYKEFEELLTSKDHSGQEALLAYTMLVRPIEKNFKNTWGVHWVSGMHCGGTNHCVLSSSGWWGWTSLATGRGLPSYFAQWWNATDTWLLQKAVKLAKDSLCQVDILTGEDLKTLKTDFVINLVQPQNTGLDAAKPDG